MSENNSESKVDKLIGHEINGIRVIEELTKSTSIYFPLSKNVTIYKCKDIAHKGEERILKRLSKEDKQIFDEINRLVEVRDISPHSLVKYYSSFSRDDNAFYFVMDAYELSNVEKLLEKMKQKDQVISSSKIMDFAMQILDALAFIHSRKIIHRDLRPKNCLIDELGNVILTEFGLRSNIDVYSDDFKESLNYASPELFENSPSGLYDHRIDLWSFGCLLYELITLKKAIEGSSIVQIVSKINKFVLSNPPNDIDEDFAFVLKKTLQKNKSDRDEADALRDQLSIAYENKTKERLSSKSFETSLSWTSNHSVSSSSQKALTNVKNKFEKLGDTYFEEKNFSKALEAYLEEFSRLDEKDLKADFLTQIGLTYEYLNDFEGAVKFYERSLEVLNKHHKSDKPNPEIAKCLQSIGIAYRYLGEFK